jgi:TPP-dependent pyruvate/acetoin dehydrogenase alpha subunit
MTREYHDDLIQGNSDSKIINRIAAQVGIELMKKFPHDYIISKYREKGEEICRKLNLTPSNTLTLALGNEHDHKDFFRNGYYRVCITNELLQDV